MSPCFFPLVRYPRVLLTSVPVAPVDSAQYARTVREDTAELANYQLTDKNDRPSPSFLTRKRSRSLHTASESHGADTDTEDGWKGTARSSERIPPVPELPSPEPIDEDIPGEGPSLLARALKMSPPEDKYSDMAQQDGVSDDDTDTDLAAESSSRPSRWQREEELGSQTETSPLLRRITSERRSYTNGTPVDPDLESQKAAGRPSFLSRLVRWRETPTTAKASHVLHTAVHPKSWDGRTIWETVVLPPIACLPAVVVGLLLNVLDALSYGMHSQKRCCCTSLLHLPNLADIALPHRNDSLSSRQPDIRQSRVGRNLNLLRQHHHIATDIFLREYIQGRHRI